jgi:subtilisin family serine protease
MKNSNYSTGIRLIAVCVFVGASLSIYAQNYKVIRGERPPVNLSMVEDDAYVKGIVKIKLTSEAMKQLREENLDRESVYADFFGIAAVDELNRTLGVEQVSRHFDSPALNNQFTERHKAWGFHQWFRVHLDESADIKTVVQAYMGLGEIEFAEPEYRKRLIGNVPDKAQIDSKEFDPSTPRAFWTPNDPRYDEQWHYHNTGQQNGTPDADIDLPEAWELEKGNSDLIVAIVDEGVQFNHPDLEANMWENIGFNFVTGTANVLPGNHGTHVAGTVAAVNNNSIGVSGIAGGDGSGNGIRLMSAQVFTSSGSGGFDQAQIWAADNGAAISQNSWGYTSAGVYEQSVLDAIDYFNANGGGDALVGGGIVIFAAGNDGTEGSWYPGFYSGTFAVASTNNQDIKSWYSNYGEWIDVSAPGGETNNVNARGVLSTLNNGTYGFYQGTSMACPHVSGVAALVGSLAYGEITPQDLAEILMNSADNHYGINPSFIGKLGSGRLNAYNALMEAQNFLTGVRNPASFGATVPGPYQVDLSWTQNTDNNPVMIAWSNDGDFGTPVEGSVYNAGDLIPGGGIVLYKGSQTAYQHTDLSPATTYFYKAWSYNVDIQYSTGRSVTATTSCEPFDLPFSQNFEGLTSRPICWSQENEGGGLNWTVGAGNGASNPPSAYEGSSNIYHKSEDILADELITRLITPQLKLSGLTNTELKFWYTNARRTFIIWNFQDELNVYYKNSAQGAWMLLQSFNTNVTDWTEVIIPLPNPTDDYYLAFEGISNAGHGVCLDQVQVVGTGGGATYTITASSTANGSIQPNGEVIVNQGANQDFQVNAAEGYQISNLTVDGVTVTDAIGQSSYTYSFNNVSANHSIAADFALKNYIIQSNVSPAGSGTVNGSGSYAHGQTATLTAVAGDNYDFSRWTVNGNQVSTDNPYSFVVNNDLTVTAVFEIKQTFSVSVLVEPANSGTVTGEGNYSFLQSVTLTAIPAENFVFVAWMENGELRSTLNPFTFFIGTDRSFTAVFASNSSVNENLAQQTKVYPNPATEKLTISLKEPAIATIADLHGNAIMAAELIQGASDLDVSSLSKGVYLIYIQYKEALIMKKFIRM